MNNKFTLNFTKLSLALLIEVAVICNFPEILQGHFQNTLLSQRVAIGGEVVDKKVNFKPPKVGAPDNRVGGASRSGGSKVGKHLKALLPASNLGLTVAKYPAFFVYIPQISTQLAEFELREENNKNVVYKTRFLVPPTPGIVGFSLPANKTLQPLKTNKSYHWYFSIIRDPQDRSEDLFVEGWVQRIEPSPSLVSQLEKAAPRDRPAIYAEAGIWHETLTTLAKLRDSYPQDLTLVANWTNLLESVGLTKIAKEPLEKCLSTDSDNNSTTKGCQSL